MLTLFMAGAMVWLWGYALELAANAMVDKLFFAKLQYFGIVLIPLTFFVFVNQYLRRASWPQPKHVTALLIEPVLVLALVWTNSLHGLIWSDIELLDLGTQRVLKFSYGAGFLIHTLYSYVLLAWGLAYVVRTYFTVTGVRRRQALSLIAAVIIPWSVNLLWLSQTGPVRNLDLTPFSFTATGLILLIALLRFGLLDVVPLARDNLFDKLADAVLVFDAQGRLIDQNGAAEQIVGSDHSSVVNLPAQVLLKRWPSLVDALQSDAESRIDCVVDNPGGCLFFEGSVSPLYDHGENLVGRMMLLHDTTEHALAQEALRQSQNRLQSTVEELREQDRQKSDFIATISHELRTPLTNIKLYLSLLQRGPEENHARYMDVIVREADSLQNLVDTMLDLSRLDALLASGYFSPVPVDMGTVVLRVLDAVQTQALAVDVQVNYRQLSDSAMTLGNRDQLMQLVTNLILNAIVYAPRGGVVDVALSRDEKEVTLQVYDDGLGMTEEEQAHAFDRFYRGPRAVDLGIPGVGLGLSIAREIVALHSGKIEVESRPNWGSQFTVNLPAIASAA